MFSLGLSMARTVHAAKQRQKSLLTFPFALFLEALTSLSLSLSFDATFAYGAETRKRERERVRTGQHHPRVNALSHDAKIVANRAAAIVAAAAAAVASLIFVGIPSRCLFT